MVWACTPPCHTHAHTSTHAHTHMPTHKHTHTHACSMLKHVIGMDRCRSKRFQENLKAATARGTSSQQLSEVWGPATVDEMNRDLAALHVRVNPKPRSSWIPLLAGEQRNQAGNFFSLAPCCCHNTAVAPQRGLIHLPEEGLEAGPSPCGSLQS